MDGAIPTPHPPSNRSILRVGLRSPKPRLVGASGWVWPRNEVQLWGIVAMKGRQCPTQKSIATNQRNELVLLMPQRTTKIELTPEELQKEREAAATLAAQEVLREVKDDIESLRADLKQAAVVRDIVPEHVLLDWLDVSRKTLKRWEAPVSSEQGQTRFYHMRTVIDYLSERDWKFELKLTE